ncbi:MAG: hypothetical protein VX641_07520 [Planctomycetota bacterium]|nr:hypothetical protein [Planctomycetota bacterium]
MSDMIETFRKSGKCGIRQTRALVAGLRRGLSLLALLLVLGGGTGDFAQAASQAPQIWTLDIKPGPLRLYVDPIDDRHYHYFTYQVVNSTKADRMFAPTIELFTDTGQILPSGSGVSSQVSRRLMGHLANPLMEDEHQIIGDLKQGKEHAKDGLVIWEAVDLDTNQITIFVTGLSNGINRVPHPVTGEDVLLRKTLRLDYVIPGNLADTRRADATPDPQEDTERAIQLHAKIPHGIWIWR